MTKNLILGVVLILSAINLLNAQFYAGAKVGFLNYTNEDVVDSDFKFQPGLGIQGGTFVNDQLFIDGNIGYFFRSKSTDVLGISLKTTISSMLIAANAKYLLSDDDISFYICSDLGLNNYKISVKSDNNSESEAYAFFGFAPGAGFFISKDNDLMFKIEANYHIYLENKNVGSGLNAISLNLGIYKKF